MRNMDSMVTRQLSDVKQFLVTLHQNDRGDNENLGRMLILALVLIPLIIVIAVFGQDIVGRAKGAWDAVIGKEVTP